MSPLIGLGSTRDSAVLAKAALVHQGVDTFANREAAPRVLLGHRFGPAVGRRQRAPPFDLVDLGLPAQEPGSTRRRITTGISRAVFFSYSA